MPITTAPRGTRVLPWLPLSPLNLAACITWAAIVIQVVPGRDLLAGNIYAWIGLIELLSMLALLLARSTGKHRLSPRSQLLMILGQAMMVVLSGFSIKNGWSGVLLIIVSAQLAVVLSAWQTIAIMLAINAVLVVQWNLLGGKPLQIALDLLPVTAFQTFAGLTAYYQASSERRRDELAQLNAQLIATQALLEESNRNEERLKLSRELHDVAGHKLTALKMNLALMKQDPMLRDHAEVGVASTLANELLADIRAVVSQLRYHDGIDLRNTLDTLTRQIPGPIFKLQIDEDARPASMQAAEVLLRCAQEGITNAIRHGQPEHILLQCRRMKDQIELRVHDDGSSRAVIVAGNGLNGMRERLEALGGWLQIGPTAERGVELIVALPVQS